MARYIERRESEPINFDYFDLAGPEKDCFEYIKRKQWGASKSVKRVKSYTLPAPYVAFTTTASKECEEFSDCVLLLQDLQKEHFSQGYADIKYNFLVNSLGQVYEGRGWRKNPSMDIRYRKPGSKLLVAFIGDFTEKIPSSKMFAGAGLLLSAGIREKHIDPKFVRLPFEPEIRQKKPRRKVVKPKNIE